MWPFLGLLSNGRGGRRVAPLSVRLLEEGDGDAAADLSDVFEGFLGGKAGADPFSAAEGGGESKLIRGADLSALTCFPFLGGRWYSL